MTKQTLREKVEAYQSLSAQMDRDYRERVRLWREGRLDIMQLAGDQPHMPLMKEIVCLTSELIGPEDDRLSVGGIPSNSWRLAQAEVALNG